MQRYEVLPTKPYSERLQAMKLKAAISDAFPDKLVRALNKLRPLVLERVLMPHLHVPADFGPAEFYVQKTDDADGETHPLFVEARLSGVSWTPNRANNDFRRARQALEDLYVETTLRFMEVGQRAQFNITLMLDQPLPGEKSMLVESDEMRWVTKVAA